MGEHTPTPWRVGLDGKTVRDEEEALVVECFSWFPKSHPSNPEAANAALIVKAVNSHQALVEALRDVLSMLDQNNTAPGKFLYSQERIAKARAALALAGEKI